MGWHFFGISGDFLFWPKSKNPEIPEIPGIGIGIWQIRRIWDFLPSEFPWDFFISEIGIFFLGWDIPPKSQLWFNREYHLFLYNEGHVNQDKKNPY